MSLISAVLKAIGCIIFIVALMGFIGAGTMAQFTDHDSLRDVFIGMRVNPLPSMSDVQFAQYKAGILGYCHQTGKDAVNLAEISPGSPNATMKCSDVSAIATPQEFVQYVTEGMFDVTYYKNYSCDFISCMSQLPDSEKLALVVSAHANAFFKQVALWAAVCMIIGLAITAIAIRKLFGILRAVGIEMAIAGAISYLLISFERSMIPPAMSLEITAFINNIIDTLIAGYLYVLVIGIVLAVIGIVGGRFLKRKEKAAKETPVKGKKKRK